MILIEHLVKRFGSLTAVNDLSFSPSSSVATTYDAAQILADPHFAARGDLVVVDDPVAGPVRQQAPFPRLDGRQPTAPTPAPTLGQHNRDVWCGLVGLTEPELEAHMEAGVI